MASKELVHGCMDLALAQRIGLRPHNFRVAWWERALRILMRWAEEPCPEREYQYRLRYCRKVYQAIQKYERMRAWRDSRWKYKPPTKKRKAVRS